LFNLRHEFPGPWSRFLNPTDPAAENVFELVMEPRLFPLVAQEKALKVTTIWLLARCTDQGDYKVVLDPPLPAPPPPPAEQPPVDPREMKLARVQAYGGLHFSQKDGVAVEVKPAGPPVAWKLKMTRPGGGNLQPLEVREVLLVLGYDWE
jgi:hypothetical protein